MDRRVLGSWLVVLTGIFIPATAPGGPNIADRPLPGPGWRRVEIPQVGTIDVPPTMEVQAGLFSELGKSVDDTLSNAGGGQTNLVLQQKGLNALAPGADKTYVRVIVRTDHSRPGDFASLSAPFSATAEELNEVLDNLKREVEVEGSKAYHAAVAASVERVQRMSDAEYRQFLRQALEARGRSAERVDTMSSAELGKIRQVFVRAVKQAVQKTPRVLEWYPARVTEVGGVSTILIAYRRQLGSNPAVVVRRYTFQNYDRCHHVTLSYRASEAHQWQADLDRVLESFRITNVLGDGHAPASPEEVEQQQRLLAGKQEGPLASLGKLDIGSAIAVEMLLTLCLSLSAPLLLRYAVLRKPIGGGSAVLFAAAWGVANFSIWSALGSDSVVHGSASMGMLAIVSYHVLRAGARKKLQPHRERASSTSKAQPTRLAKLVPAAEKQGNGAAPSTPAPTRPRQPQSSGRQAATSEDWFYHLGGLSDTGGKTRRVTRQELDRMLADGTLSPGTLVRSRTTHGCWTPARDVEELCEACRKRPQAPRPRKAEHPIEPDQWFYSSDQVNYVGPVEKAQIIALLENGTLTPDALVWRPEMPDWKPVREVHELDRRPPVVPPPLPMSADRSRRNSRDPQG